jgi:hypothetical protein
MYRFGIGVYLVDNPVAAHWYVQWHTQEAVLARGGALVQRREPETSGRRQHQRRQDDGGGRHRAGAIAGEPGHFECVLRPAPLRASPAGYFGTVQPAAGVNPSPVRFPMGPMAGDRYYCGFPPDMPPIEHREADIPATPSRADPVARFHAMARTDIWSPRPEPALPPESPTFVILRDARCPPPARVLLASGVQWPPVVD